MRRTTCATLLSLVLAAAAAAAEPAPPAPPAQTRLDEGSARSDDLALTRTVQRWLLSSPDVLGRQLTVSARGGIVTLGGTVDSILAREQAEALARCAPGVRAVMNRIVAHPPARGDELVRSDALLALGLVPALRGLDLRVQVDHGRLIVAGIVPSWVDKQVALSTAMTVPGAVAVRDGVMVDDGVPRGDDALRRTLVAGLDWSLPLRGTRITPEVSRGVVSLTGTVATDQERRVAEAIAWAAGAREVANGLTLDPALPGHLAAERFRVDERTAQQTLDAVLKQDDRLAGMSVAAMVDDGTATLAGSVATPAARLAAVDDALGCAGVLRVQDALIEASAERNGDLAAQIQAQQAIDRDPELGNAAAFVQVRDGRALVTGAVVDAAARQRVLGDVAHAQGLQRVDDALVETRSGEPLARLSDLPTPLPGSERMPTEAARLWLGPLPAADDATLQTACENALRMQPIVDASRVTVRVEHGVATLTGEVPSWRQRVLAAEAARDAQPIWVRDRLALRREAGNGT